MVRICLHCLNYTKSGQLILRKTIKIVATRGQILRLKCTAQTPLWEPTRSLDPLAGFKGPTSKGREGKKGRVGREEGEVLGKGGDGKGREGKGRGKKGEREGQGRGGKGSTMCPVF